MPRHLTVLWKYFSAVAVVLVITVHPVAAQVSFKPVTPTSVPLHLVPRAEQITLALSAAPPGVSDSASVYVLGEKGYEKARDGSNGFTCLVQRLSLYDRLPRCDDAGGSATIVQVILHRERMRAEGKPGDEIRDEVRRGYGTGRFRPAPAGGISYMLAPSCFAHPETGACPNWVSGHIMIYAPYATMAGLGLGNRELMQRGDGGWELPTVIGPGTPEAHIVIFPKASRAPRP